MPTNTTLQSCLDTVDSIEEALSSLGDTSSWPAFPELQQRCREFRDQCRELVSQKDLGQVAIAFIGPKNAGKTTLLTTLIRNPQLTERLNSGLSLETATEKITWIGSHSIRNLDRAVEQSWQVDSSELANLGFPFTLVDVPGSNESNIQRAEAAKRALQTAHIKVLVVEARTMEDSSVLTYIENADGAVVLPVINQIRPGTEEGDIDWFLERLQQTLPSASILEPIRVHDLMLYSEEEAGEVFGIAAEELRDRIIQAVKTRGLDEMLEPQLIKSRERFQKEMRDTLWHELPATAAAAKELQETESDLAVKALEQLLGADTGNRAILVALRQQLRAVYLQRTTMLYFPWRTFVSMANLLHGALDKVPLVLVGSLPSLLSSTLTAVKNAARDREFTSSRKNGLQEHAELLVKQSLYPQMIRLEAAIRSDLRSHRRVDSQQDSLEVSFEGLDLLQSRSSGLFEEILGARGVSRFGVWITGAIGMVIFWSIFSWPMVALYTDYFSAVLQVIDNPGHHEAFPAHSIPMLATAFVLALLPMLIFMVLILSWAAHQGRARRCLESLRRGHHAIIQELNAQGLLRIRSDHPRLRACLRLFST